MALPQDLSSPEPHDDRFIGLIDINPAALLADGLDDAYIGYTVNHHHAHVAVYDYAKCIEILVQRDGMDYEGADEFLQFNTLGAYVGENGPLFIYKPEEIERHDDDS